MAAKTQTPAAQHTARLDKAMEWLRKSNWTPANSGLDFDYSPYYDRAMSEFGMRKDRAEALIAKAARRLRGEAVSMGGRGDRRANFNVKLDVPCVVEIKSLDATIYHEAAAKLLNGNGTEIEVQFKMQNSQREMVDTILTLRVRETDD